MAISPNKRKSQSHMVQTPKKQKNIENKVKTPVSNKKDKPQNQVTPKTETMPNTPKSLKKNTAKKEKLIKFPGTGKLSQQTEDLQETTVETPTKTVNVVATKELKAFVDTEMGKGKMRYVLFLGNLPFDVTAEEIKKHFENGVTVKYVRLPRGRGSDKRRTGFGYLEVADRNSYIKALSMHQTVLKGRPISIQCTTSGKKNSATTKSLLKKKNVKLNLLRGQKTQSLQKKTK